jgi:hypothetical protein
MAQENIGVVRDQYAATNERDYLQPVIQGLAPAHAPNVLRADLESG